MKTLTFWGLIFYIVLLILTRFYNIAETARFTQDESGFLVRAHQIYVEKKLTLIGQVNEQGKVFGSLTVYLLLPFAILGEFDPRAMFYGAAFWGVITSILLLGLAFKINRSFLFPAALLTIFWFPLLQTGRWAWNPNLVPLWVTLGLILWLQKKTFGYFLAGLAFGLSVHHHYFALFATGSFCFLSAVYLTFRKQFLQAFLILAGFIVALLPFILFDLRHPPGLFFMGASHQSQSIALNPFFWQDTWQMFFYLTQSTLGSIVFIIFGIFLFWEDFKTRSLAWLFLVPILLQRLLLYIVAPYFFHYYLVLLPFWLVWIVYPRSKRMFLYSYTMLCILIFGGLMQLISLVTTAPIIPDLPTQVAIVDTIKLDLDKKLSPNANIAVLASDDHDVQAVKYREILLGRDNISFDSRDEYFHSDHLYVISTANEATVRQDAAPEMHNFQQGPLLGKFPIAKTNWFVYHFSKPQP